MSNTAYLKTPQYPVISWPAKFLGTDDDLEIGYDGDSESYSPADAEWQTKYGFSDGTDQYAQSDSVHGHLASKIQNFLVNTVGISSVVRCKYIWDKPGWPRVQIEATNLAGNDLEITAYNKDVGDYFGIDFNAGGVITVDGATGTGSFDFNSYGYWAPNNLTCYDDRSVFSPATYTAQSLDGTVNKTVKWSEEQTLRQITFPFVRPPYIWTYRKQDPGYSTPAGLNTDDPNNLFEKMMEAARFNNTSQDSTVFRIYASSGSYRTATIMDNEFIKNPQNSISDSDGRSAKYFEVSVTFKDTGGDGI